jgi:release factor glutamine methyltransferase
LALTVAQALAEAKAEGVDRLDAQLLLGRTLARPRSWLLAHDDAALAPAEEVRFRADLLRRGRGEPLAYVLGEKEFHGLTLHVNAAVLVPRPETETLVDWALELLHVELAAVAEPEVLDLGTGSGAIALALKHACPRARICALDVSVDALAVARGNAQRLGLDVDFRESDWWAAVAGQRFHLVVSNPPYVEPEDPHLAALQHEPRLALTSGEGGLQALRTLVEGAPAQLMPGAWLLLEHGHDQAAPVQDLLRRAGFAEPETRHDLAGQPRCTGARR